MKNRIKKQLGALGISFLLSGVAFFAAEDTVRAVWASEVFMEETEYTDEEILKENEQTAIEESEIEFDMEDNLKEKPEMEVSEQLSYTEDFSDDTEKIAHDENVASKADEADLVLTAVADSASVKAGSDLVYTIHLENPGNVPIQNICLKYEFSENIPTGIWTENNIDVTGATLSINRLDAGAEKELYLTFALPEEQEKAVSLKLSAEAEVAYSDYTEKLVRETEVNTVVDPLKASFEVTKAADRSVAVPGDKIVFQICIRNTGERTLHSVVTTERFQLGNVPVEFVKKEGIVLNKNKTKARVDQILPGKTVGLEAVVTLPENLTDQELLNEVTVMTQETGKQVKTSGSVIQIKGSTLTESPRDLDEEEEQMPEEHSGGKAVSENPKTGDPFYPFLWITIMLCAVATVRCIYSRM